MRTFNKSPKEPNTKITKSRRIRVFKRAHYLVSESAGMLTFSKALTQCWGELKNTIKEDVRQYEVECNKISRLYDVKLPFSNYVANMNKAYLSGSQMN